MLSGRNCEEPDNRRERHDRHSACEQSEEYLGWEKNRTRPGLQIEEIYEYDIDSTPEELDNYCKDCDFLFNLAGVNRPKDQSEFYDREFGLCLNTA